MTTASEAASQAMTMLNQMTSIIAQNVANANTSGFRQTLASVAGGDPSQVFMSAGGAAVPLGELEGAPASLSTVVDPRPGPINHTGNPLDLAIDGAGYFTVLTPQGPAYTRDGHFHLDGTGQIVTNGGDAVAGTNGPLVVPAGTAEVSVASDGTVTAGGTAIGTLQIVTPPDPQAVTPLGNGLYQISGTPGTSTADVVAGALEGSNVSVVEEMAHLITVMRAYEGAQQVMQLDDTTKTLSSQSVGSVT
jgi:flagellar basal-body rod protein FlgF